MEQMLSDTRRGSTVGRLRPGPELTSPVTFHYEIQDYATRMQKLTKAFKVYRLTVLTFICVAASLLIGLLSRPYAKDWTERHFMKLSSHFGKVACFFYLGSNLMAISIGILLALIVCPGKKLTEIPMRPPKITIQLDNHHYFSEYHDSMKRYREYHPMFYHTDRGEREPDIIQPHFVGTATDYLYLQQQQAATSQLQEASDSLILEIPTSVIDRQVVENSSLIEATQNDTFPFGNIPKAHEPILDHSNNSGPLPMAPLLIRPPPALTINHTVVVKYPNSSNFSLFNGGDHRLGGLTTKLPIDVLLDVFRNLVPDSVVGATLQTTRTRLFAPKQLVISINGTTDPSPSNWPMGHEMVDQANIIGLLAISVLTGVVLSHMDEAAKPLLELCACVAELSLRIGMMAIHLTPFCIMFLLIGQVARTRDLSSVAGELCMYSVTVLIALLMHGFLLLPLIYYLVTRKSPIVFLLNMHEALVASFATSSSSASMALMLKCLNKMELNPVIVGAFGPLGSVFNMNGTAIYEAIGGIFIAQTLGVNLSLTSLLLVGLSAAVASFSTSGIPSSGMMTMVIVLNAINMPVLQLSLLYIVDFIIDRFRTVINVWSGAVVCALINHICPEHLFEELIKQSEKYREKRSSLGPRRVSNDEEGPSKPKVISVTITPPMENSHI